MKWAGRIPSHPVNRGVVNAGEGYTQVSRPCQLLIPSPNCVFDCMRFPIGRRIGPLAKSQAVASRHMERILGAP